MEIILGRRASILAIIFSSLFVSIFSKQRIVKIVGLSLALCLICLIGVLILTPNGRKMLIRNDKINLLLQGKYAESGSFGKRIYIWPIYLKKALEDPFSGTGIGRKAQKTALYQTNKLALKLEHAHNLFLNLWLQAGLHTMVVYFILYLYTLFKAYKLWHFNPERPIYALFLAFLLAFLVMSILEGTEEGTRFTPFWITCGLIWGLNEKNSFSS